MTAYTIKILSITCPNCGAAITAHCLEKTSNGSKWRSEPHEERVDAAKAVTS